MMTVKMEAEDKNSKYKIFVYLGSAVVILGTAYNNYNFYKSTAEKKDANSTYANMALIPIYLSMLILAGMMFAMFK